MHSNTYFLETFGCTLNQSDSEIIKQILEDNQLIEVDNIDEARLVIINTCAVKAATEQKIFHKIKQLKSHDDKVAIIAGCLPLTFKGNEDKIKEILPNFGAIVGPRNYHLLEDILQKLKSGVRNIIEVSETSLEKKIHLSPKNTFNHLGILPISEGCMGACNFCCTRFARGHLKSYPPDILKKKFLKMIQQGIKEVWITAEDCSAYHDKKTGNLLPSLLEELLSVDSSYFLRVGMMNPRTLSPILDDLINVYKSPHVFKFIHVPVQAGSNDVLTSMNRKYTIDDFHNIIDGFRCAFPEITLSTDIICGFPGETDEDFEKTLDLVKDLKPDIINISMYGHRPGTVASRMKPLPSHVIKQRSKELTRLHQDLTNETNNRWVGWEGIAVIDEFNAEKVNYVARNSNYKPVILEKGSLGRFIKLKITSAEKYYYFGKIIEYLD
ncbi:MAG: tRNA (N(6)-L-threonylcarbamoyladenosine(37)-C(2))-methylthiotransferase [Candidatus Hodarchaeota archaeon]